jgi:cytochrome c biogenesis protein CcmG/thiol:disulfide interchange protein DsbE
MKFRKAIAIGLFNASLLLAVSGTVASNESIKLAPNFEVQNLTGGEPVNLEQFQGKVVYVDFWASWCGPCLKSFPFMEELHRQYGDQGLVVVAINMDQDPQDAHDFLAEHPVTFLLGQDRDGAVAQQYGVMAMPSSFIVGRDGLIENVHYGFKSSDKEKIESVISQIL